MRTHYPRTAHLPWSPGATSSDRIDTARRRPLPLDALRAADADVIALQEAEPALLGLLLSTPWVRESYTLWAGPAGRDVADCGLLLLSRLPVREAGLHVLGPHKAVAAVVVATAEGPLTVAVTHLSSDLPPDGAARRDAEPVRRAARPRLVRTGGPYRPRGRPAAAAPPAPALLRDVGRMGLEPAGRLRGRGRAPSYRADPDRPGPLLHLAGLPRGP
ncbi:endonuclease/exonuclease/phosphatase family protein [Streptomyces sp. NPDC058439]|uniref:endonuclease/exonuclease/phosphatase family protein n=1 Tax=Streptomyces sp. NPDC058439 TaxID=3346500 RepID=UPI00365FB8C5